MLNFLKRKCGFIKKSEYPFHCVDGQASFNFKVQTVKNVVGMELPEEKNISFISSKISKFKFDDMDCYKLYNRNEFLQLNYRDDLFLDALYAQKIKEINPSTENDRKTMKNLLGKSVILIDDIEYYRDVDDSNENKIDPFQIVEDFNGEIIKSEAMIYRKCNDEENIINNDLIYISYIYDKFIIYSMNLLEDFNI